MKHPISVSSSNSVVILEALLRYWSQEDVASEQADDLKLT